MMSWVLTVPADAVPPTFLGILFRWLPVILVLILVVIIATIMVLKRMKRDRRERTAQEEAARADAVEAEAGPQPEAEGRQGPETE